MNKIFIINVLLISCYTELYDLYKHQRGYLTLNVFETDHNGVIDIDNIFHFHQDKQKVHAEYRGEKIYATIL